MSDISAREWVELNIDGLEDWYRRMAASNPAATRFERDGVFALKTPAVPERSLFNGVIYTDPDALAAIHDELTTFYGADECAWTVWSPEADTGTAAFLQERGHVLDATPTAMGIEVDGYPEPELTGIEWDYSDDFEELCAINDAAYGLAPGSFAGGLGPTPPEGVRLYAASLDGKAVAAAATVDRAAARGPDCTFWLVATLQEARGKGIAGALMRRGLWDAAERGCATSTLQATKMGAPIYEHLGFGGYGAINMWELRPPGSGE